MKQKLYNFFKNDLFTYDDKRERKIILFIAIVFTALILLNVKKHYDLDREAKELAGSDFVVANITEYMEEQKSIASDIEGMTMYDKIEMGLMREEGSDSDHDGLTDKEEIEIYGTDPLNSSTVGDLYTDGYKAEHNMDLFTAYEYEGDNTYWHNDCPEVTIEATNPNDFYASIEDITNTYSVQMSSLGYSTPYKGYLIYHYDGYAKIDLTDVFADHGITKEDIRIITTSGPFVTPGISEFSDVKYTMDGNVAVLKDKFDKDRQYIIYILSKPKNIFASTLDTVLRRKNVITAEAMMDVEPEDGFGIIAGMPVVEQISGHGMHIDYAPCASEYNTKTLRENLATMSNEISGSKIKAEDNKKISPLDKELLKVKVKFYELLLPDCSLKPGQKEELQHFFFFYTVYNQTITPEVNGMTAGVSDVVSSGFDKYTDELPFQNFKSVFGTAGNCAGISHLTSYLYNKKQFPSSGSHTCDIGNDSGEISWDLSVDSDNNTLCDPGLNDYKSVSFVNERMSSDGSRLLNENLNAGEEEFVKMIGCYLQEGNEHCRFDQYGKTNGELYSNKVIANMMSMIDRGKIVDVYMGRDTMASDPTTGKEEEILFGHVISVYAYKCIDEKNIEFKVYDCNFPQDDNMGELRMTDPNGYCTLRIRLQDEENTMDGKSFAYEYFPTSDSNATYYNSYMDKNQAHLFVAMNEDFEVLE